MSDKRRKSKSQSFNQSDQQSSSEKNKAIKGESNNSNDHSVDLVTELANATLQDHSKSMDEQEEINALKDAQKVMYFLIKHNLPYSTLYKPLMELCIDLGATNLQKLSKNKKVTYQSAATAKEFLECQAEMVEKRIKNGILQSGSYGLMIDEYTDVSTRKHLAVVCRYIDNGCSKLAFLHDVRLGNGRGETIYIAMKSYLDSAKIPLEKMTSFVSDGAPAMMGKTKGVVAFLQKDNESVLTMHCMNHRLQLAIANAFSSIEIISKTDELLSALYIYYHFSTTHTDSLNAIQQMLRETGELESRNTLTVKRAVHTRWLSHEAAVQSVKKLYKAIIMDLDAAVKSGKNKGIGGFQASSLLEILKKFESIYFIHLLDDVCTSLASLTKIFETEEVDLSSIGPAVSNIISKLREMKEDASCTKNGAISVARELNIDVSEDNLTAVSTERDQFIDKLISNIEERMRNSNLICHLSALNLTKVERNCLTSHGNEAIKVLADHFKMNVTSTLKQWGEFKEFFKENYEKHPKYLLKTLTEEKAKGRDRFQNIYKLLMISETLVISTSAVERVFSQVQLNVTPHRNRLDVETVNKLLIVGLNAESVNDLDLDEVVKLYLEKKNRRISTN